LPQLARDEIAAAEFFGGGVTTHGNIFIAFSAATFFAAGFAAIFHRP
jgi:hypothetical protein